MEVLQELEQHLELLSVLVSLNDLMGEWSVCLVKMCVTLENLQIHWRTEFKFNCKQEIWRKNLRRTFRINKCYLL